MPSRLQLIVLSLLAVGNPLLGEGLPQTNASPGTPATAANPTYKSLIPDLLQDQKWIYWNFPRDLAHGQHWMPVGTFLGTTGFLIAVDQYQAPYFRKTTTYHAFNTGFSGINTAAIMAGVPAAIYLTGLAKHNSYAKGTALLMGEAIADSAIAAEILKLTTRRARPQSIPPNGNFADTFLDSPKITAGGFPSGHTITAFSAATVLSRRYGQNHRWVPYLSYGVAAAIGFSRVTLSAHNVSDVFAGAALGYLISRFIALAPHCHSAVCAN